MAAGDRRERRRPRRYHRCSRAIRPLGRVLEHAGSSRATDRPLEAKEFPGRALEPAVGKPWHGRIGVHTTGAQGDWLRWSLFHMLEVDPQPWNQTESGWALGQCHGYRELPDPGTADAAQDVHGMGDQGRQW